MEMILFKEDFQKLDALVSAVEKRERKRAGRIIDKGVENMNETKVLSVEEAKDAVMTNLAGLADTNCVYTLISAVRHEERERAVKILEYGIIEDWTEEHTLIRKKILEEK